MNFMQATELLTPKYILNKITHEKPYVILPQDFKSYDDLLKHRDMIRDLKLVPVKSEEIHQKYNSLNKEELLKNFDFSKSPILFQKNEYPYLLPLDVNQYLIWVQNGTPEDMVLEFLQNKIDEYGDDVIIFERSLNIETPLVKGSFKHLRHIHFWFKLV